MHEAVLVDIEGVGMPGSHGVRPKPV
jgi:hypothetical protein